VARLGRNDALGAEQALARAIELAPGLAEAAANLAAALLRQERHEDAAAAARRAVELAPEAATGYLNLGRALHGLRRLEEARTAAERATMLAPEVADGHLNLGGIERDLKRSSAAVASLERAQKLAPDDAEVGLNLGLAYRDAGRLDEAIAAFEAALASAPKHAEVLANLATALRDAMRPEESLAACQAAIALKPDEPTFHSNLSISLWYLDRPEEAATACRQALEIDPQCFEALSNLGNVLTELDQLEEALNCYDRALALEPDDVRLLRNRADVLLIMGRFAAGYEAMESRWRGSRMRRPFSQPQWDGSALEGRSILVWGEQGVGDTIVFASCLGEVLARAERCIFETDARMVALFARSFPGLQVVARQDPPAPATAEFELQCPIGTLARWLRPDLAAFPRHQGYLRAAPEAQAQWRRRLDELGPGLKVGIVWRSSHVDAERRRYYSEIADWGPLLRLPGIRFVSLMYDEAGSELALAREKFDCDIKYFDDIDLFDDIDGAAALTAALDLLITPLSMTSWLAGALGVRAWTMTIPGEWRMFGSGTFPWCPSVRMIEKPIGQAWPQVLAGLAEDLAKLAAE